MLLKSTWCMHFKELTFKEIFASHTTIFSEIFIFIHILKKISGKRVLEWSKFKRTKFSHECFKINIISWKRGKLIFLFQEKYQSQILNHFLCLPYIHILLRNAHTLFFLLCSKGKQAWCLLMKILFFQLFYPAAKDSINSSFWLKWP